MVRWPYIQFLPVFKKDSVLNFTFDATAYHEYPSVTADINEDEMQGMRPVLIANAVSTAIVGSGWSRCSQRPRLKSTYISVWSLYLPALLNPPASTNVIRLPEVTTSTSTKPCKNQQSFGEFKNPTYGTK